MVKKVELTQQVLRYRRKQESSVQMIIANTVESETIAIGTRTMNDGTVQTVYEHYTIVNGTTRICLHRDCDFHEFSFVEY